MITNNIIKTLLSFAAHDASGKHHENHKHGHGGKHHGKHGKHHGKHGKHGKHGILVILSS